MAKARVDNEPDPRALQRFAEQLDAEVQEAHDAARARHLAPFESVLRRCQYVQTRYITVEPRRGLPKHFLRRPAGLTIPGDLAAAVKTIEPHLLDACLRQLHAAIEMLRPFDGRPFGRKPIILRGAAERTGKQTQSTWTEEEKALVRLEQAAAELVHLFRVAAETLSAQAADVARKPAVKRDDQAAKVLTPPQLAAEMGIDVDKVYAFIRSGELRATNTAIKPGGKARYRISRADVEDFQRRRQNSPPPPPSPKRRKRDRDVTEYY